MTSIIEKITISLPASLLDRADDLCYNEGISRDELIENLIQVEVDHHEGGNRKSSK
jgi:metal-responsive CopG/Arc/MetJ family transcriptional regulator